MQAMDSRRIGYFLALCDDLHFTRAARRCGISQPSLSKAIGMLERKIGGALFHRKPRLRLSELGRSVQPHLCQALAEIARPRSIARTTSHGSSARADHGTHRAPKHLVEDPRHVAELLA